MASMDFVTAFFGEAGAERWLGLLSAFIGCFVEDEREQETTAEGVEIVGIGENDDGSQHVVRVVQRTLRYLVYDGDAQRARVELERLAETVTGWLEQGALPTQHRRSSCVRSDNNSCAVTLHRIDGGAARRKSEKKKEEERKREHVTYDSTDASSRSTVFSGVVLPCSLMYIVYCLACSQCAPETLQTATVLDRLVCLLFDWPTCTSAVGAAGGVTRAAAIDSGGIGVSQGIFTSSKDDRRFITRFFVGWGAGQEVASVFLFIDAYHAWLMRDYHSAINNSERFLCVSQSCGGGGSCLLWLLRETLRVVHAFAVITVTSIAHSGTRSRIKDRLRRVSEGDYSKDMSGSGGIDVSARPLLTCAVCSVMHCELFCCGNGERCCDTGCSCEDSSSSLEQVGLWYKSLFVILRVWLRAKRLIEDGLMTESRDLLLVTLERLDGDGACGDGATTLGTGAERQVVVRLLPFFWLRQLLLVSCAGLADTHTMLHFLQRLGGPLTVSEVMYLSASPTLAAGGVYSPIFATFLCDWSGAICTAADVIKQFEWLPLPVQIPLLSHYLWRRWRCLCYEVSWRSDEGLACDTRSLSLRSEVLHLCEALVSGVRGLVGSLELSFTDCAPHRVIFSAITVICEIQESLLRDAVVAGGDNCQVGGGDNCQVAGDNLSHYADDNSDSWLRLTTHPVLSTTASTSLSLSSSSSSLSSFLSVAAGGEGARNLYWAAHCRAEQWMDIFERNFSHLPLLVQVCRLRISAASFDGNTARVARQLITTFSNNALVAAHCAIAFATTLHVVSAERCIRKAVEQYPHSAELQRIHRTVCGPESILEKGAQEGCGEDGAGGQAQRAHATRLSYTYMYRGVLSARYVAFERRPRALCMQIAASFLCVGLLVVSFLLHLKAAQPIDVWHNALVSPSLHYGMGGGSIPNAPRLRVSFALPYPLSVYWGLGIIVYAVTAALVMPFLALRSGNSKNRSSAMTSFLCALMEENCLQDNSGNRLVFCLRGLPLLNLLTGVQLVVANALRLDAAVKEVCASSGVTSDRNLCGRVVTTWSAVSSLLLVFLLAVATIFHGRAWRVLHCRDAIVGSFVTFITVFLIDVAFFVALFPILFLCSVVLEPILFFANVFFGGVLSLPLLVEHIPSSPSDELLTPPPVQDAGSLSWSCGRRIEFFCAQATSWLCERLCASMPPVRWSPSRRHDRSIVCVHEVMPPPPAESRKAPSHACGKTLVCHVRMLWSRGIATCTALHAAANWRSYRSPRESEAAMQLALLRESYSAIFVTAPRDGRPALVGKCGFSRGTNGVGPVDTSKPTPPRDAPSKISYG